MTELVPAGQVRIAPSVRAGWYRVVDALPSDLEAVASVPGYLQWKNEHLVHRTLVRARPDLFDCQVLDLENSRPVHVGTVSPRVISLLKGLRPYQHDPLNFAHQRPGVLVADDVGVGKTLEAIGIVASTGLSPVLIVSTLLSKGVWCGEKSEPWKWLGVEVVPLSGRKDVTPEPFRDPPSPWFFVHYDVLAAWMPFIFTYLRPKAVIFDEAHRAGPKTQRGRAALDIARFRGLEKRVVLTATPVRNSRLDFWGPLSMAEPDAFGTRMQFGLYFVGGARGEHGWVFNGETNTDEFLTRLSDVMIQRLKSEVLKDLPPLQRQAISVEPEGASMDAYHAAHKNIRQFLFALDGKGMAAGVGGEQLVKLTKMLSALSLAKVPAAIEQAEDVVRAAGKLVIFTWFKETANQIAKGLADLEDIHVYGPMTGEDAVKKRTETAQAFADDTVPSVFIATLAAMSESINELAACQEGLVVDLYWVLLVHLQAEGRLHRSGQKGSVMIRYMTAKGTVDEHLMEALEKKAASIENAGLKDGSGALVDTLRATGGRENDLLNFMNMLRTQHAQVGYLTEEATGG